MPRARARADRRRALAYRNEEVVHKFVSNWDVTVDEAAELFDETLKLLWVVATSRARGKPFRIDPALFILDQMWHTFVLFTPEYAAYCQRAFGEFLHHTPKTRAERAADRAEVEADPAGFAQRQLEQSAYKWELVLATYGEDTLFKWWVEQPARYDATFFRTKAKPVAMSYRPPERLLALAKKR